jgi:hypothetical protein
MASGQNIAAARTFMKAIRWLAGSCALAWLGAGAPVEAQPGLDREALKLYGGTYSADCGNAAATRLRVLANALTVEQGDKRLTGNDVQAAHSFFGQSAPPNYLVALLSEVRGGSQMLFIVFRDGRGQYITPDGDQRVQAALGKTLLTRKFYQCAGDRQAATPAPAVAPVPATTSSTEPSGPPDLLKDSMFKSAYFKALGAKAKEPWLTKLDGPAPLIKKVRVAGTEYLLASVCKPHDCADNNTVLLYSAQNGAVYGKVLDRRRASLIGDPPAAVAAELDRLWAAEWRQK